MIVLSSKRLYPRRLVLLSLGAFIASTGCRQQPIELAPFNGEAAYQEVVALVKISPRDAGTPGARKAAEHLLGRLQAFGVAAEIDTFKDQTPEGEKTFHNVIGRIPGKTDRWIILGSHFDTMPGIDNFQGANDSGSSTGVLLELARTFSKQKPELGLMFAFFDGEEGIAHYRPGDGLHGSRRLATQLVLSDNVSKINSMILMDMVGDPDLHFTLPYNTSTELAQDLFEVARRCGERNRFTLSKSNIIDDHVPFLEVGIPAINLIDFKFGSAPGLNDYWHTAHDNLEHIDVRSLQITGGLVQELVTLRISKAAANP